MNNIEKIKEQYITAITSQSYISKEALEEVLRPVMEIISQNKDATPNEWITEMLKNATEIYKEDQMQVLNNENVEIPGMSLAVDVNDMKVRLNEGYIDVAKTKPMCPQAIFDIASITKDFTLTINDYLIKEGYYNLDSKIVELDPGFKSLPADLTVRELVNFSVAFNPDGYYVKEKNSEDATKLLKENIKVTTRDIYNYNDYGMMILGKVMENVTGKSYDELFKHYINDTLQVDGVYTRLDKIQKALFTGTPNASLGLVNDSKANAFGGVAGHAGVKATADGLTTYMKNRTYSPNKPNEIEELMARTNWGGLYTASKAKAERGFYGNWNIANPKGVDASDSPIGASKKGYSLNGSTRTHTEIDLYKLPYNYGLATDALLTNPATMTKEKAVELEKKLGMDPGTILTSYTMDFAGTPQEFMQADIRRYAKVGLTTDRLINAADRLKLRLMFIEQVAKAYETPDYWIHYHNDYSKTRSR